MKDLYHFANLAYGRPFIDQYAQWPAEFLQGLRITVVFSLNFGKAPRSLWQKLRGWRYQWRLQRQLRRQFKAAPFQVKVVQNINHPRFLRSIPTGSIAVCSGFDQIFTAATIERFESFVNVHPSVLPYYRGPVPSYWCLQNGERQTGFSWHRMSPQIDRGELLYQETLPILPTDTETSLDHKIAVQASKKLLPWLRHVVDAATWEIQVLDASKVYRHRVDYRSFGP